MSLLLQLALAIHAINPHLPDRDARKFAAVVVEQADDHRLDPWLLFELVHKETHWIPTLVRHEDNGSCSVGLGQINGSCEHTKPMLDPVANLRHVGLFLSELRRSCRVDCDDGMWLRGYNPGSAEYAPAILAAVAKHHVHVQARRR